MSRGAQDVNPEVVVIPSDVVLGETIIRGGYTWCGGGLVNYRSN